MTTAEKRAKARRMYARKRRPTLREIADEIDVSLGTAHRYVNPEADERYRVATRERKRIAKQEIGAE